ncbi:MAG: hypothetical protein AB2421_06510 [Thermotaleaceae bacterium]
MVNKPWFKVFLWFLTTFFFFMASGVILSIFKPGASEMDVMRFMSGMMGAMETSIMGVTMGAEDNGTIRMILSLSYFMLTPIIAVSIVIGFTIRFMRGSGKNVS